MFQFASQKFTLDMYTTHIFISPSFLYFCISLFVCLSFFLPFLLYINVFIPLLVLSGPLKFPVRILSTVELNSVTFVT